MPTIKTAILLPLTLISGVLCWLAQQDVGLPRDLVFITKPLTTILIIIYAWQRGHDTPLLRRWVILGLFLSLAGDVFLMWPQYFVPGLLAFLAAHIAYLWAFTRVRRFGAWIWGFVVYALIAGAILSQLWPHVPGALRAPVAAYVIFLGAMAAQAAAVGWLARGTADAKRGAVLALGGALFLASDACLAINKFGGPVPVASLMVLPTYWTAQWCIASWLERRGG
jgi:uncharacterized membrane protein YhhN